MKIIDIKNHTFRRAVLAVCLGFTALSLFLEMVADVLSEMFIAGVSCVSDIIDQVPTLYGQIKKDAVDVWRGQ